MTEALSRRSLLSGSLPSPPAADSRVDAQGPAPDSPPVSFDAGMHEAMATMMAAMEAAPMTGNPEQDFLAMMIPHHQGAIDMARLVLLYGRDPLVRQLAEGIIVTQQTEIASMQNRLALLRSGTTPDAAADQALGGTRGDAPATAPEDHSMHH